MLRYPPWYGFQFRKCSWQSLGQCVHIIAKAFAKRFTCAGADFRKPSPTPFDRQKRRIRDPQPSVVQQETRDRALL